MKIETNKKLLVNVSVMGSVCQPNYQGLPAEPYRLDSKGNPFLLPSWGSVVHNVSVGDSAFGWEADCIHPGVSIKYQSEAGNRGLNILACVGNEAIIMSGDAKNTKGIVTGKSGRFSEQIIIHFPKKIREKISINDKILIKSRGVGLKIEKFLNISTCEDEFMPILKISDNNKNVFSTLGIHPHEANNMTSEIKNTITKLSSNKKVIGIGETGLDFYYENSNKENQIKSFIMHIEISQELGLPLVIHMRNAENETIDIIKTYYKKKEFSGVIHCFTGTTEFMQNLLPYNFFFSISGIVTFKNSTELRETIKMIPINKVLVETDSPYLAPVPVRGRANEPAYITHTVEYVSKMFNLEYSDFSAITSNNFFNLFKRAS